MSTKTAQEAWQSLRRIFWNGGAFEKFRDISSDLGLQPGLLRTLLFLAPDNAVRIGDLAQQWKCDASYATNLADGLEEKGYVRRQSDPTDRRVKTIALTPKGISARKRALALLDEPPEVFEKLTVTEQRQLRDLCNKLLPN